MTDERSRRRVPLALLATVLTLVTTVLAGCVYDSGEPTDRIPAADASNTLFVPLVENGEVAGFEARTFANGMIIDPAIAPASSEVGRDPDGAPTRAAAVQVNDGPAIPFVENRLLFIGGRAAAAQFAAERGASIIGESDASLDAQAGTDSMFILRIPPSRAPDEQQLVRQLQAANGGGPASIRASNDVGLATFGHMVAGLAQGHPVGLDIIANVAAFADGPLLEAPIGPPGASYSPDLSTWPWFEDGGNLDVGVLDSWRMIEESGRTFPAGSGPGQKPILAAILDVNFHLAADRNLQDWNYLEPDYPRVPLALSFEENWNSLCCGTGGTNHHGDAVIKVGFGVPGNGMGGAGPGGPVAEVFPVHGETTFSMTMKKLDAAFDNGARIASMSFTGFYSPWLGKNIEPGGFPLDPVAISAGGLLPTFQYAEERFQFYRDNHMLLVAAAGNQAADIGEFTCLTYKSAYSPGWPFEDNQLVCAERLLAWPCEGVGVLCVGGTNVGNRQLAFDGPGAGSNYHSEGTIPGAATIPILEGGVDLFASYRHWSFRDDPQRLTAVAGTSFATPFVAGSAAALWYAVPQLSADAVEAFLIEEAHRQNSDDRVSRSVDLQASMQKALCPNPVVATTSVLPSNAREGDDITVEVRVQQGQGEYFFEWNRQQHVTRGWSAPALPHRFELGALPAGDHLVLLEIYDVCRHHRWAKDIHFSVGAELNEAVVPPDPDDGPPWEFNTDLEALPPECQDAPPGGLQWSSDLDGPLGTGPTISTDLTPGTHTIRLHVMDPDCEFVTDLEFSVPEDESPIARIAAPAGNPPSQGQIQFEGTGTDPEDGNLDGASLQWYLQHGVSMRVSFGSGTAATYDMDQDVRCGTFTFILEATDSAGNSGADTAVVERICPG